MENSGLIMADGDVTYDYLIIGGGSAGGVLASRLSELAHVRILLVEAGPDMREGNLPPQVASPYPGRAYFDQRLVWPNLKVRLGGARGSVPAPEVGYEQGRGLGGCSAINGIGSNRGGPEDYDEWHREGAEGWGWDEVLPYFRKLESEVLHGHDADLHGTTGPWPITHINGADFTGFTRAVHSVLTATGHVAREDQNGTWQDGIYPTAVNLDAKGRRATVATTYLREHVRKRQGLEILCEAIATRILFEGSAAVGAEIRVAGRLRKIRAREVIVCAGALHTPTLLLRSGIGPAHKLTELGIEVVADRPGVGENLMEHPSIGVSALIAPQARQTKGDHYHIQSILRWSSRLDGVPTGDMHTAIVARAGWHAVGYQMASLFSWVNKSYSRGRLSLRSADPERAPDIDFRLLSDPRDLERLTEAFRFAARVLTAPAMQGIVLSALPSSFSPKIKRLLAPTLRNRILTEIAAPLIDRVGLMRNHVMRVAMDGVPPLERLLQDAGALEAYLCANVGGVWHACGTARMGRAGDPMAVTSADGRVHGVQGLRVCDASLMPTIPCANINVPVLMMAEKIADKVKAARNIDEVGRS